MTISIMEDRLEGLGAKALKIDSILGLLEQAEDEASDMARDLGVHVGVGLAPVILGLRAELESTRQAERDTEEELASAELIGEEVYA